MRVHFAVSHCPNPNYNPNLTPEVGHGEMGSHGLHGTVRKVKERIAVNGFPSSSYGTSLAIWDHTLLPATRHK